MSEGMSKADLQFAEAEIRKAFERRLATYLKAITDYMFDEDIDDIDWVGRFDEYNKE